MPPLPFTNGFYVSESLTLSNQECINYYVNKVQTNTRTKEQLFPTPGIGALATTGTSGNANRGSWVKNGIGYFVNGEVLYSLDRTISADGTQTFSYTSLGAVSGTGRVSMADNGTQLMILVPGGNGYIYNEDAGTPFAQITDGDFIANGAPQHVIYNDGYFVVTTDTKKWILSDLNDGLSWNALAFGTAESDPDAIVAPVKTGNQVYITGSITTEGFQNANPNATFPYIRNNVFLDVGCSAPFTLVKANQTFFMVGKGKDETPAIWQFAGSSFKKISTTAIDNVLSNYTDARIEEAFGMVYGQKGAYFILFTFHDRTFVYDLVTERWHERKSLVDELLTQWRVSSIISAYGTIIVFDSKDGRIGELSKDVYGEYGEDIIRTFSTQPFDNEKGFSIPRIELIIEAGVGNSDVPDPQMSMALYKDNKIPNFERNRSMGKVGEYRKRLFWNRNGRVERTAMFKFRCSDQVKSVIIGLEAA